MYTINDLLEISLRAERFAAREQITAVREQITQRFSLVSIHKQRPILPKWKC